MLQKVKDRLLGQSMDFFRSLLYVTIGYFMQKVVWPSFNIERKAFCSFLRALSWLINMDVSLWALELKNVSH